MSRVLSANRQKILRNERDCTNIMSGKTASQNRTSEQVARKMMSKNNQYSPKVQCQYRRVLSGHIVLTAKSHVNTTLALCAHITSSLARQSLELTYRKIDIRSKRYSVHYNGSRSTNEKVVLSFWRISSGTWALGETAFSIMSYILPHHP